MKNKKSMPLYSRVALYGVLTALALIAGYVELLLPINFGIPGIKLGLANIVVVCTLYLLDARAAVMISFVRILLSGLLFGNVFGILYSAAGGLCSLLIMIFAKHVLRFFGVAGVSVLGGIFHNLGQILVAVFVVENIKLVYYLPVLTAAGTLTGLLIGLLGGEIIKRVPGAKSGASHEQNGKSFRS